MFKYISLVLLTSYIIKADKEISVDNSGKMVSQVDKSIDNSQRHQRSIWDEFDKLEAEVKEAFSSLKEEFKGSKAAQPEAVHVNIKDENNQVIVKLISSGIEGSIEVNAKKNNLDGSFMTKNGYKVEFKIIDGTLIKISQKMESKKSEDKDGNKYQSMMASMSDQIETLPARVTNLEEAKVDLSENIVTIYLPKADNRNGWKSIQVNRKN